MTTPPKIVLLCSAHPICKPYLPDSFQIESTQKLPKQIQADLLVWEADPATLDWENFSLSCQTLPTLLYLKKADMASAVRAMHAGARDVLSGADLKQLAARILAVLPPSPPSARSALIGRGPLTLRMVNQAEMVAASASANVLLLGESGTGKNLLAHYIHQNSPRAQHPYVTITCTAMPGELIESELFGHEKGAFTDARGSKKGLCEVADGGTLFLDEIGDMPLALQAKLLGFIESRCFRRVGGTREISVDLRIIAATNRELKKEIHEGRFREDLYFRLNVFSIDLPPLRSRLEDLNDLTSAFILRYNKAMNKQVSGISKVVSDAMRAYPWPGNIRELQNMMERAMILAGDSQLSPACFPGDLFGDGTHPKEDPFILPGKGIELDKLERSLIRQALEMTNWNTTRAARLLGLTRDQMRYRTKHHGLA